MGISLYCREAGRGEPLVLLHGNGEDGSYFQKQMEYFQNRYRVIAVDTRGHGHSPRGNRPFTLEQFADDLKAFLDERGLKGIYLLGFSDGGNIALIFTLKYPGYVKKLILNGANLYPSGMEPGVYIHIAADYLKTAVRQKLSGSRDGQLKRRKELLALMIRQPHIAPAALGTIRIPVLVIAGTRDMIRQSHTRLIAKSLPHGKLRLLKGGHFIAAKRSGAFNRAVSAFLAESKKPPASCCAKR